MKNDFYVYAHCKQDGEPYYIGKGRVWRYCENVKRSNLWQKYANKYGVKHHMIAKNLSEIEAYNFERLLIAALGKRCDGTGILANLVDGGRGVVGFKHSEKSKAALSAAHMGKKLTDEHRKKMSETHKVVQNKPEIKARLIEIRNTPEFKKQASEKAAANWANPIYREKILAARKLSAERRKACL